MTDDEVRELNAQILDGVSEWRGKTEAALNKVADFEARIREMETIQARGDIGQRSTGTPASFSASSTGIALAQWMRTNTVPDTYRAGLSEGSGPGGGFWVTPDVNKEIDRLSRDISDMRRIARVVPATKPDGEFMYDRGGTESGWVGEQTLRPETDAPETGIITIPLNEIYANPKATQNLLDDVHDVDAWLVDSIAEEFSVQEGDGFVNGSTPKRPRGFTTYDKSSDPDSSRASFTHQYIPTGTSGSFDSANPADVFFTVERYTKKPFRKNAVWVMNSATHAAVKKIKDGEGRYLLATDFANGVVDRILGKEVVIMEDMADIGANAYPIAYGDFRRGYVIRDHVKGSAILRDPFTNKPHVHFYTTKRTGGGCVRWDTIKFIKFGAS